MKLRNKKTGEIATLTLSSDGEELLLMKNNKMVTRNVKLSDLDEWEDYKEPKDGWCIDYYDAVKVSPKYDALIKEAKLIGNYFETKEEAEKAVEKLKAWKRLKDKGFRFEYYDYSDRDLHNHIQIKAITNREVEDSMLYKEDLDLLFGGEE